ncbi:rhamnogalacturonan lyase [Flavobacterium cellulosilyticum]|uniref:Rhamnogalacturonan lyase n=1 Tax=Flavobacterium cellulosilyticum TaxID=2541731 RepID=A0A4R5CBV6_9FLAO|nr:rhamnogalacturonan lyase [Flavobacterium cellulosilyticum]TDD95703.1 rhamnogalacturonan lyase [Flavobacterium cellulosilyticum]
MKPQTKKLFLLLILIHFSTSLVFGQRQMETLDRGIIAVKEKGHFYIGWRVLGTDPDNLFFNLYRKSGNNKAVRVNENQISGATNLIDTEAKEHESNTWFVKTVENGVEKEALGSFTIPAFSPDKDYLSIPLKEIAGYIPNDVSVGDLNGDGKYDLIVHMTGKGADNSFKGITDSPVFQAYTLEGQFLWEINLGKNIREGAHYTQFMVYDLDGDGIAEFVCKTADGTMDSAHNVVGDVSKDWRDTNPDSPTFGKIISGPEYLSVFDGKTGKLITTSEYIPARGNIGAWGGKGGNGKNDATGNRVDRFTACIAYLDGVHPSVVMCRGYYGRTVLAAWDYKDDKLTSRWVFDSQDGNNPFSGMGNHGLSVADVDNDGKDEIIFGAMCVDDDGKGMYTTGFRHGDALHVTDLDPETPGLEVFGVHEIEEGTKGPGVALFSAATGKVLFTASENEDVGRGVADNIDSSRIGAQMWWSGSSSLFDIKGNVIGLAPRSANFLIYWDGDSSRELLNSNYIDKYGVGRLFTANGASSNNGSKSTPALSADILGDWREELILRSTDNKELRIYSTTIPTAIKQYTLMHDPQYRLSIAWQNVGYNQPPHTSFYMGTGMKPAPKPNIKLVPFSRIATEKL